MRQMLRTKLLACMLVTVSAPALAGHEDAYEDRGRVTAVTPQFERVNTPRQECRTEYVRESVYEAPRRSIGGAVIGGVAGGLIGSRFGGGSGRVATAAVGAGVGAILGDRYQNDRFGNQGRERVETRPVETCRTIDSWSQVPAGYLVNYEYNGRQYSTVTDSDPGRFNPVHVEVRPNGYITNVTYSNGNDRFDRKDFKRGRGHGHGHRNRDRNYW